MPRIKIISQQELDVLPKSFREHTVLEFHIPKGSRIVVLFHRENSSVEVWGNSSVEVWGELIRRGVGKLIRRGAGELIRRGVGELYLQGIFGIVKNTGPKQLGRYSTRLSAAHDRN
jgi:hypothetical protein